MPDTDITIEDQDSGAQAAPAGTTPAKAGKPEDVFTFRRMSGLDQAVLQTDWEWHNLA